jgi:protoporphyrinogen oxidase
MSSKLVILGAGPVGLGAGHRLRELGWSSFQILERNPHVGGLAASFTDAAGFTWDIGGHVFFSHYPYFDRLFADMLGDECRRNRRSCWVRLGGRWIPYPFQNHIHHLPPDVAAECLLGLIAADKERTTGAAANFREFMDRTFGAGLVRHFMRPYNFKVWAYPAGQMSAGWIGERVALVELEKVVRTFAERKDEANWGPNHEFRYPLRGGTGELFRRMAARLQDHILTEAEVCQVDLRGRKLLLRDGRVVEYERLISSVPLDVFCMRLAKDVPEDIRAAAGRLHHNSGWMVGIGLRQPPPSTRSWMYFPEDNCPFYRVTHLSNYSPHMTPDASTYHSLLCETSYSEFKPLNCQSIVDETVGGLIRCGLLRPEDTADIVSTWSHHVGHSYPVPTLERDAALATVLPFLEAHQVYSRGRFGLWKYEVSNTDHSVMQGVELANRLILGERETTCGL